MKIYKVVCYSLTERYSPSLNNNAVTNKIYNFGDTIISDKEPILKEDGNIWLEFKSKNNNEIRYLCFREKTYYKDYLMEVTNRFELAKYKKLFEENNNNNEINQSISTEQRKEEDIFNIIPLNSNKTQSRASSVHLNTFDDIHCNSYFSEFNCIPPIMNGEDSIIINSSSIQGNNNRMDLELENEQNSSQEMNIEENNNIINQINNFLQKKSCKKSRKNETINCIKRIQSLIVNFIEKKIKLKYGKIINDINKNSSHFISLKINKSKEKSNNYINKTIKSFFIIDIKCDDNNVSEIVKTKTKDINEFLDMNFHFFLRNLEIYLRNNNNFSNINNQLYWIFLKNNLEKRYNNNDMNEENIHNNIILKSILEEFRKNINECLAKKKENE